MKGKQIVVRLTPYINAVDFAISSVFKELKLPNHLKETNPQQYIAEIRAITESYLLDEYLKHAFIKKSANQIDQFYYRVIRFFMRTIADRILIDQVIDDDKSMRYIIDNISCKINELIHADGALTIFDDSYSYWEVKTATNCVIFNYLGDYRHVRYNELINMGVIDRNGELTGKYRLLYRAEQDKEFLHALPEH